MSGVGVEERPVDSNSVPSGPSGGQDPEWSSAFEYVVLRDSNQYERQMDSNRRGNFLLVVELFSSWCGPCQPVRSVLQRIFLATQRALGTTTMKERRDVGKNDIPSVAGLVAVRFCGLDPERIFEHAAQMRQASRPETTTSTSPKRLTQSTTLYTQTCRHSPKCVENQKPKQKSQSLNKVLKNSSFKVTKKKNSLWPFVF